MNAKNVSFFFLRVQIVDVTCQEILMVSAGENLDRSGEILCIFESFAFDVRHFLDLKSSLKPKMAEPIRGGSSGGHTQSMKVALSAKPENRLEGDALPHSRPKP